MVTLAEGALLWPSVVVPSKQLAPSLGAGETGFMVCIASSLFTGGHFRERRKEQGKAGLR